MNWFKTEGFERNCRHLMVDYVPNYKICLKCGEVIDEKIVSMREMFKFGHEQKLRKIKKSL